jgi:hypothetical protein
MDGSVIPADAAPLDVNPAAVDLPGSHQLDITAWLLRTLG